MCVTRRQNIVKTVKIKDRMDVKNSIVDFIQTKILQWYGPVSYTHLLTSIELHDIMCQLREKIKHRLDSSFYGARIKQALIYLTQQQQKKFISEANKVYTKTLDYLNDFYDFDNSYFQYFSIFDLKTHINYDNVLKLAQKLVISIDEDKIFDEIGAVNSIREKVTGMDIPIDKKWCQIFESLESSELVKIVSKVLSIPISNAFVERIFSIMNNLWTEERNNLSVPMVKAELCVRINYNMNCNEFLDFITKSDQRALLESCKKIPNMTLNLMIMIITKLFFKNTL